MRFPQTVPPTGFRFLMEVDPDPERPSDLLIHGDGLLNGGKPGGWTLERFEQLLKYRKPFGTSADSSSPEACVVVTPAGVPGRLLEPSLATSLSTADLYSSVFEAAVKEFANAHGLYVMVVVHSTYNTLDPHSMGDDFPYPDKRYFGNEDNAEVGGIVPMHFVTQELWNLAGYQQYWGTVLGSLSLKGGSFYSPLQRHEPSRVQPYDAEQRAEFFAQAAEIPESILGNPDYVLADVQTSTGFVTVVRHRIDGDERYSTEVVSEPRTFRVETQEQQLARHRGGR